MSLDFILIPSCIIIILFLFNRENKIYKKNQKAKWFLVNELFKSKLKWLDFLSIHNKLRQLVSFELVFKLRYLIRESMMNFYLKLIFPNMIWNYWSALIFVCNVYTCIHSIKPCFSLVYSFFYKNRFFVFRQVLKNFFISRFTNKKTLLNP